MQNVDVHVVDMPDPDLTYVVASRPGCNDRVLMVSGRVSMSEYTRILASVLTRVERSCAVYHYGERSAGGPNMGRKAG